MADTYTVEMNDQGRIVIPAAVRAALGLKPATRLVVRIENGAVTLTPRDAIRASLWAMFEDLPTSMADSLIADRIAEASLENKG